MLEGESWWNLCALLWMNSNKSQITKKVNRDLINIAEKDKYFVDAPQVQISHSILLTLL